MSRFVNSAFFTCMLLGTSVQSLKLSDNEAQSRDSAGKKGIILLLKPSQKEYDRMDVLFKNLKTCSWLDNVPIHVLVTEEIPSDDLQIMKKGWPNLVVTDIAAKGIWNPPEQYVGATHFSDNMPFGMGYRQMCDLWSTKIMSLAHELGLEYYLRLDSDSVLTCSPSFRFADLKSEEKSNLTYFKADADHSLFDAVSKDRRVYGYYDSRSDVKSVSRGVHRFVKDYAQNRNLNLSDKIASSLMTKRDKDASETFNTNMEVVDVKYFLRDDVQEFTRSVAENHGIYEWRWGDAIIRYWQVTLFSQHQDIKCLTAEDHITYSHQIFGTHNQNCIKGERVTKGEKLSLDSSRKAGTPAFNPGCAAFPDKRVIMVTPNSKYWEMFLNWFHHAKAYMGDHDQLVVVAQDQGALTNLQSTSFAFVDLDGNLHQPAEAGKPSRELKPSGIQIFNNLVGKRPAQISYFLNQNCTVLYTDIDTVWVGDVFQEIANAGPHDLYVTDDHWEEGGSIKALSSNDRDFDKHWYFCSCFLYFQPSPAVQDLVKKWAQGMNANTPDQPVFNRALGTDYTTDRLVDFTVLPLGAFPNGRFAEQYWGKPGVRVLHANYRVGIRDKKQFLVDHGVWKP